MSKRHSEQFKQEAVGYALSNKDKSVKAIATQLGVGYSTLDNWLRQHRQSIGGAASKALNDDQKRIRQLEREVAHLKEVNEIIKKAHVYFVNNPSR
jgi:transposase